MVQQVFLTLLCKCCLVLSKCSCDIETTFTHETCMAAPGWSISCGTPHEIHCRQSDLDDKPSAAYCSGWRWLQGDIRSGRRNWAPTYGSPIENDNLAIGKQHGIPNHPGLCHGRGRGSPKLASKVEDVCRVARWCVQPCQILGAPAHR